MILETIKKHGEDMFCQKTMPGFGGPESEWYEISEYYRTRSLHQRLVDSFHRQANLVWRDKPVDLNTVDRDELVLRARLILKEALETINRGLGLRVRHSSGNTVLFEDLEFISDAEPDAVELVDGCFDLRVVTTGTLSQFGIPDHTGQMIVDKNNLRKCATGTINEHGKLIKSPSHVGPTLELKSWLESLC